MNSPSHDTRMAALAYIYDNLQDYPAWLADLTSGQLQDIAFVMSQWQLSNHSAGVSAIEELERREVLRAMDVCHWNVQNAAKVLKMGRSTIYRKMKLWGYTIQDRALQAQATVLAGDTRLRRRSTALRVFREDGGISQVTGSIL